MVSQKYYPKGKRRGKRQFSDDEFFGSTNCFQENEK